MSDVTTANNPLTELTARVVSAYLGHHRLSIGQLPDLIGQVHAALDALGKVPEELLEPNKPVPAVPIRKSVHDDYLICLEDGKKFKTLKRHLMTRYGMTIDEYRERWGLPSNYPVVAPGYAARRSEIAKSVRLGHVQKEATPSVATVDVEPPKLSGARRKRKPKATA